MIKGFPDLPPLWWAGSIDLIYVTEWLLPGWHIPIRAFDWISWTLLGLALAIIAWSAVWFWRKRTPIEPHHTPKALIVEGPYRLSRNPIYLALVLLTLASAFGHGSIVGLGLAFALWRILEVRFVLPEEAGLRTAFGADADAYIAATRRWI